MFPKIIFIIPWIHIFLPPWYPLYGGLEEAKIKKLSRLKKLIFCGYQKFISA